MAIKTNKLCFHPRFHMFEKIALKERNRAMSRFSVGGFAGIRRPRARFGRTTAHVL